MMVSSGLIVVILIVVVSLELIFQKLFMKWTLLERLVFAILLVLAGGLLLIHSLIRDDNFNEVLGAVLFIFGLCFGVTSFLFKRDQQRRQQ